MPNPIMIPADPAPALAKGFANIADIFAPPSARDAYYGTEAGLARAKTQSESAKAMRIADFWSNRESMTPEQFDRGAAALGLNPVTQGYAKLDVDKRGQDKVLEGTQYTANSQAATSRANNADTLDKDLKVAIMSPLGEGQTRIVDPGTAARYSVPQQGTGIVKLNEGQLAVTPPGPAGPVAPLQGNTKPLTEAEAKGKIINDLSPEERHALGLGEIKTGPVYGTPGGTAYQDPVTKQLVGTQDKAPLPAGTKATNLGAPSTTVNVGPNGEPFGAPPAGMAWARNTDGTVQLDDRGAPKALVIGGTPLADKQAQALTKQGEADKQRTQSGNIVTQDVDRALAAIDADPTLTTGAGSQITGSIGGSPAKDLKGLLDSVRANVGFDRLQQMRASSPTGGALGQVSDKENALLQSVLGSLDQSQGPTQLKQNLKRVKDVTLDIVHGPGQGPARSSEPTAIDPQTKHRMVYRGGQWVSE